MHSVGLAQLYFPIHYFWDSQTNTLLCAVNSNQLFKCEVSENTFCGFPLDRLKKSLQSCPLD